jgi:hypothetical protein
MAVLGKHQITWPNLGTAGGLALESAVHSAVAYIGNNLNSRWSGSQTLANGDSLSFSHRFDTALANLAIQFYQANAPITQATQTARFTVTQSDLNTISVQNTSGVSQTFEFYLQPRRLIRSMELEADQTIAGNLIVAGNLEVQGTQVILNTNTLEVEDPSIVLNNGGTNGSAEGAGLEVEGTGNAILATLKYEAALASRFKIGANGAEKQIVTVSDVQTLTLKDIDGGTATNTSRITLPKASKTALDALTRKQATLLYASDQDVLYVDNGTSLLPVGGNWTVQTAQSIAAAGAISISLTTGLQAIPVSGNGGPQIASSTPFGATAPANGTVLRLFGTNNTNTLEIQTNNAAKGAILNGERILGNGSVLELQYLALTDRWHETFFNNISGV